MRGVPFDVAWAMEDEEMLLWQIAFGELEGRAWDFESQCWVNREPV